MIVVAELWFVLAIATAFLWGSFGILAKLSTPKLGVSRVAMLIVLVQGLLFFLGFYFWRNNVPITFRDGVLAATSCLLGTAGILCYFEAVLEGQVAIAGTITAGYPALGVIGAVAFLSETLTVTQALAVVAIVGGVIALSYEPNPSSEHAMPRRSLFFALLAFVLWGFWTLTSKIAIDAVGPGNIFGFYVILSVTAPFVYVVFRRLSPRQSMNGKPSWRAWTAGAAALALNVLGVFAFTFALKVGPASLVVPISAAYPVVTVMLAVLLLHEKLRRFQIIALSFILVGVIAIGFTG
jgi:transporter family protein